MIQLSVIIPTRNRSSLLNLTLTSITKQSLPKDSFEVIVVDNGSTDDTKAIVDSFKNKLPHLIYHYDDRPGLHVGRHDGYKLSNSDILVYADDDIEAFPTWLETIYEEFQDKSTVLVGGKNLPKFENKPPFWILEMWYRLINEGHCLYELSLIDFGEVRKEISPFYVFGCNYAIRKSVVHDAGGFHPDGVPIEMIRYRGDGESYVSRYISDNHLKTIYNPKASVYHQVPKGRMTVDYFCERAFRAGVERSYVYLRSKNGVEESQTSLSIIKRLRNKLNIVLGFSSVKLLYNILQEIGKTEIERQMIRAERTGYDYHQKMYKNNKDLQEWVHKKDYWE